METIQSNQLPPAVLETIGKGDALALMEDSHLLAIVIPASSLDGPRPSGLAESEFVVPDDFNDPLPDLEESVYGK